jgi:hypothetical protein
MDDRSETAADVVLTDARLKQSAEIAARELVARIVEELDIEVEAFRLRVAKDLEQSRRNRDGRAASEALCAFVIELFWTLQPALAKGAREDAVYLLGLEELSHLIEHEAASVYTAFSGIPLAGEWLAWIRDELKKDREATASRGDVFYGQVLPAEVLPAYFGSDPLPEAIHRRCRELGIGGKAALAKKAGYSRTVIFKLLTGESISNTTMKDIADALEVPNITFAEAVRRHRLAIRGRRSRRKRKLK